MHSHIYVTSKEGLDFANDKRVLVGYHAESLRQVGRTSDHDGTKAAVESSQHFGLVDSTYLFESLLIHYHLIFFRFKNV